MYTIKHDDFIHCHFILLKDRDPAIHISTLVRKIILQPNEGTQNAHVKVSDSLILG